MNNRYVFEPSSIITIIFTPDHCTLEFLKVKCNPANKNNWAKTTNGIESNY